MEKGRGQVLQLGRTVKLEPGSEGMPRNKEHKNIWQLKAMQRGTVRCLLTSSDLMSQRS